MLRGQRVFRITFYVELGDLMFKLLWSKPNVGTIAFVTDDSVIVHPDWRGGVWSLFRLSDGALLWRRWHYRGGHFCFMIKGVIIASCFYSPGIYALDWRTGRRLWSRLGYTFNWFLKICDLLPVNNEGDSPLCAYQGNILTNEGFLLDPLSGQVNQRCKLEVGVHLPLDGGVDAQLGHANPDTEIRVDGQAFRFKSYSSLDRYGLLSPDEKTTLGNISSLLHMREMVISDITNNECVRHINGLLICVACDDPHGRVRKNVFGHKECVSPNVPHRLIAMRESDLAIVYTEELGNYAVGRINWSNGRLIGVMLQTDSQYHYSSLGAYLLRLYSYDFGDKVVHPVGS